MLLHATRLAVNSHNEMVMMVTGPDTTSVSMTHNALNSIASVGLRENVLLMADSAATCRKFAPPCYWSSRVLRSAPSRSIASVKFWDWRFRFYYVKKKYIASIVRSGFSVLQADVDTVWQHDPFPVLRTMEASIVTVCAAIGARKAACVCVWTVEKGPGTRGVRSVCKCGCGLDVGIGVGVSVGVGLGEGLEGWEVGGLSLDRWTVGGSEVVGVKYEPNGLEGVSKNRISWGGLYNPNWLQTVGISRLGWGQGILQLEKSLLSISCYFKILLSYSRFARVDEADLDHFSARVLFKFADFHGSGFSKHEISENRLWISGFNLNDLGALVKSNGFRRSLIFPRALKIIKMTTDRCSESDILIY